MNAFASASQAALQQAGPAAAPRALTIAILAMGGEGGGVLADWLVDLAESNGYWAQTTSVPGVAQRTGATVYYVEMFRGADVPAGCAPVMALSPVPGEVDVVVASELMEAGRALQRGLATDDRTTLVASTHRVYSMTERTAMGDERTDPGVFIDGARAAARHFIAADFNRIAEAAGSPISPALYGALAASAALPFAREQFEDTIRRGGVGVGPSLRAFAAGFEAARAASEEAPPADMQAQEIRRVPQAAAPGKTPLPPAVGPRLAAANAAMERDFPAACHEVLRAGLIRAADYQDPAYAGEYLDRLRPLLAALPDRGEAACELLRETARHLALWMTYEDIARVADLKTRGSRFERVAAEVKLTADQHLEIDEFMHPRLEELADAMPARLGRWMMRSAAARACIGAFTRRGRVVRTSSLRGYLLLYAVAALRGPRRRSLRFQVETGRMARWLGEIVRLAPGKPALALEVARAQRLIKGYGDTHARGWGSFQRVMDVLPALERSGEGAARMRALVKAALSDENGRALESMLAGLNQGDGS